MAWYAVNLLLEHQGGWFSWTLARKYSPSKRRHPDTGGERAAGIYSLIGTAKLNEIDPESYLHYVLGRVADHAINRIEGLLPWRVAADLLSLRRAA